MRQPKRSVWVKIRARESERAEWHTKARRAGLSLSALVRRAIERTQTWTVAHAEVERARAVELARIGNNLNQIARWANTHKARSGGRSGHGAPGGVAAGDPNVRRRGGAQR